MKPPVKSEEVINLLTTLNSLNSLTKFIKISIEHCEFLCNTYKIVIK